MQCVKTLLLVLLTYSLLSCVPTKPDATRMGDEKTSDCGEVPIGVTLDKRELDLAGAKLAGFSLGKLEIKDEPQFQKIISEAASNSAVTDILVCKTINRAEVRGNPEMVDYFTRMTYFLAGHPTVDEQLQWRQKNPFPNKKSEVSEQKPKLKITFNGLSQKELQAKIPLPIVLDPSLRAVLTFKISNVGNGPVLDTYGLVAAMPPDVRVGHRGAVFYEKPNHNLYQTKIGKILPREISGMDYELDADVRVPETIDTFSIVLRIYGDNLPHEDLELMFHAIHAKRP